MKRFFRYFFGISFLVLGIIGLFLPILQGILFLFIGFIILAPESRLIRRMLSKFRKKYPAISLQAKRISKRFTQSGKKK